MRHRSDGFTLIEMLITVTIFGIIVAVGVQVIGLGFTTYTATDQKRGESLDRQLLTVQFGSDVSGASVIDTTSSACTTGTVVAHFQSTDITNTVDVYYTVPSPFVSLAALTRTRCVNGTATASLALATRVSALPTLTCATSCATSQTVVSLAVPETGGTFTIAGRRRL